MRFLALVIVLLYLVCFYPMLSSDTSESGKETVFAFCMRTANNFISKQHDVGQKRIDKISNVEAIRDKRKSVQGNQNEVAQEKSLPLESAAMFATLTFAEGFQETGRIIAEDGNSITIELGGSPVRFTTAEVVSVKRFQKN